MMKFQGSKTLMTPQIKDLLYIAIYRSEIAFTTLHHTTTNTEFIQLLSGKANILDNSLR